MPISRCQDNRGIKAKRLCRESVLIKGTQPYPPLRATPLVALATLRGGYGQSPITGQGAVPLAGFQGRALNRRRPYRFVTVYNFAANGERPPEALNEVNFALQNCGEFSAGWQGGNPDEPK